MKARYILIIGLICLCLSLFLARESFGADCTYPCSYSCNCVQCNPRDCKCKTDPKTKKKTCQTCYETCCETCSTTCPSDRRTDCGTETRTCQRGQGCVCVGRRYLCYDGLDKSCTSYCNGRGACDICQPPDCRRDPRSQGTDADNDGYDAQCEDCDDNNALINPSSANKFCDCSGPSGHGVPETTGCDLDETRLRFKKGCLCMDGKDNDCNGLVDTDDPACPDLSKDWWIDTDYTLPKSMTINGGVWVNGATLTIPAGLTLSIKKDKGLHVVNDGNNKGKVELGKGAKITFHN